MRKRIVASWIIICMTFIFANNARKASHEPLLKLRGDESIKCKKVEVTYPYVLNHGREEVIIGTTAYDYQAHGGFGQRITLDSYLQAHINWMYMDMGQTTRFCAWNARRSDSSYCGQTQASPSWSGYVQLDVTRDADPDNQRTVIAYHYNPGSGYYSWIDIDGGNLWGIGINNPRTPGVPDHIWPYVAVANNGNIVLATGDYNANMLHLYMTTDEGDSWTSVADFDSCANLSQFVRSSINAGSDKVVFVWTQFIQDSIASGQLDNNVWYMLSEDGGFSWGQRVNITDYQPSDSVRAFCCVNAVFDLDDNLHISWAGRKVTDNYYDASKIFHWDEVNNTITVVSSPSTYYSEPGGWWINVSGYGDYGAWRMPADQPQLTVDILNGNLLCLWGGNDDYTDYSAGGYVNGEIFGALSTDGGLTWTPYSNLTNTRSPGANPGECMDEDYFTVYPRFYLGGMFFHGVYTYVLDKDAGGWPQTEGVLTDNPVYCYYFFWPGGCEEEAYESFRSTVVGPNIFSGSLLLPEGKNCRVFDITGRTVALERMQPGIYFIEMDGKIIQKVIKVR
ncbi:MAG: T9SS type A sorting domain-containing protein [bacterium]